MAKRVRGSGRARGREALLREAMGAHVPDRVDVCVVGGGAAGLAAGIAASERGATVSVLERDLACGRTILSTGNGRCNLGNRNLDPALYNDPSFVAAATGGSWLEDVLDFFQACGLACAEEDGGRLYPLSRQASSVRSVLLGRARRAGVALGPARAVDDVRRHPQGHLVSFSTPQGAQSGLVASSVVLATGGGAGVPWAHAAGIPTTAPEPVLCPLRCTGPVLEGLDGRRVRVRATLERDGAPVLSEAGEVLLRDYGLSGIVVFDLSRHARPGDTVSLDLLPGMDGPTSARLGEHTLDGLLDPEVAAALEAHTGSRVAALALARHLPFRVLGPAETGRAQVTRGGLATSAFDPASLECRAVAGVFACGEALDVDGPCGGYNLAWAWKSGLVAGGAAASHALASGTHRP